MGETETTDLRSVERALERSERAGLRFALLIRAWLLAGLMTFSIVSQDWPQGFVGAGFLACFLGTGLVLRRTIQRERDAPWMRYVFVAFEAGALALAAVLMPLSTGGEVPQIFVFRSFGIDVLFFLVAMSALSLSPALVLWAGACGVVAHWSAWTTVVLAMERTVSWSDLPASAPADVFLDLFLDPDFIGTGTQVTGTLLLVATALVLAAAVSRARRMLHRRIAAEQARSAVTEVFGRFVPSEVAAEITAAGGALAPVAREASVLFVDVEGFTRFAETEEPARVIATLDAFFNTVSQVVVAHRGVVISLIGDAAMAAFNAPLTNPNHAADAVAAARALHTAVVEQTFGGAALRIRIGVATGRVAAGTVGGQGRRAYTLYGDTVNLAQRLEEANKAQGTCITLAGETWDLAGQPAAFVPGGVETVRGRGGAVATYTWAPTETRTPRLAAP